MSFGKIIAVGCLLLAGACSREVPQDKGVTIMLDDPIPVPARSETAHVAAADETTVVAQSGPVASASPGFSPSIWDGPGIAPQDSAVAHP